MKTTHILLLCILGAALVSTVVSHWETGPEDCCFKYYPKRVKINLVRSYYKTDSRCSKAGVILVTRKSNNICVDPSAKWVQDLMDTLDDKLL